MSLVELPRTEENAQAERINNEISSSGTRIVQLHCMQYLYYKTSNTVIHCREKQTRTKIFRIPLHLSINICIYNIYIYV